MHRIIYNFILFLAVIISLKVLRIDISTIEMGNGEYFIFLILLAYILLCNLVYTLGWIIELFIKRSLTFATRLLKIGLLLSLIGLTVFTNSLNIILK